MPSAPARGRETATRMLMEAELWATLASLVGGKYPFAAFEHIRGLLAGRRARTGAQVAHDLSREIRDRSLAHLGSHIRTSGEGRPIIVFNGQASPRTDLVRVRALWPVPGTMAISIVDMWDRPVAVAIDDVTRHAGGSVAAATLVFRALDVPSVGYRTYRMIGLPTGEVASDFDPPAVLNERRPLIGVVADAHRGHLPPAAGLLQIDPVRDVELISLARGPDESIVMRVREMTGRARNAEIHLFVDTFGDSLRVSLRPRQTLTITTRAERAPWAPDGPFLAPEDLATSW